MENWNGEKVMRMFLTIDMECQGCVLVKGSGD